MSLRSWHYGKLIILWAWGVVVCALLVYLVNSLEPVRDDVLVPVVGIASVAVMVAIAASLSVVTWKWLGGKEGPGKKP